MTKNEVMKEMLLVHKEYDKRIKEAMIESDFDKAVLKFEHVIYLGSRMAKLEALYEEMTQKEIKRKRKGFRFKLHNFLSRR